MYRCQRWIAIVLLSALGSATARADEAILQYFGSSWNEIARRIPELAEAGYNALWLPPPFKAGSGTFSVGFDTYDRFDLGSKYQMSTVPTKYGTESDLLHLMEMAHRFGLRVYFDNVMAHNGGPMPEGPPGTLSPIGFVPEDFHFIRTSETTYRTPDWPDYNNEWEVLNRNPFGQDIAQENPNTSFGWNEGDDYPKWSGIRHPNNPEYYPDTDLPIQYNNGIADFSMVTFANKEPFSDIGYTNTSGELVTAAIGNGRFDWQDLNGDGQHNVGEPSEPFEDTGIDPSRADRRTTEWGYGDGIYNMGNPQPEDVNAMLYRAVRWFVDRVKPDGFRLDAVKHVPAYFFGKMDDPKNDSDWGYNGQIQVQYNITRGYSDWNDHRDTVFNNVAPRDDALLFGEHLGDPPWKMLYVDAGMRIANDDFLNALKDTIGSNLQGLDNASYGIITPGQSMLYAMSHDNNYLWGGDRQQAFATLLTREGIPIVYTDGYNQSGPPDWFPKPAEIPFLGQFGQDWMPNLLDINRHFGWGYQASRWSAWDYLSYTRYDEDVGNNDRGVKMVFAMSKNYIEGWPLLAGAAVFPEGARLFNYSIFDPGLQVQVLDGGIKNMDGSDIYIPPNRYYAFSWRIPGMPTVWGDNPTNAVRPISIYENGAPVGHVSVTRRDGRDGDPAFNPLGLPDADNTDYAYTIDIPRVTSATNLRFVARADGSAENILMKLNGGIDLNAQMAFTDQTPGQRDNPPAVAKDQVLGYEQMQYVHRVAEKFAARDTGTANIIGSVGAETYIATIGSAGFTVATGSGYNTSVGTASFVYHDPEATHQVYTDRNQFDPAPAAAANQPVTVAVKVGAAGDANAAWLYYTTDGSNPEGSAGTAKGSTIALAMTLDTTDDNADWWTATLPALSNGTQLRYKIGAANSDAASRFPWSDDDIAAVPHMETVFEITNFNAATIAYFPHNDYGTMATGLDEGFHVLRTKAFLGRGSGDTPIFREHTQTFYYDAALPTARFLTPTEDGVALTNSSENIVIRSDRTVEQVWYKIEDTDPSNDDAVTGLANGNGTWAQAGQGIVPAPAPGEDPELGWELNYVNIPSNGAATITVVLRELSSSTNLTLTAAEGHFRVLTRSVSTGSSGYRLYVAEPMADGRTLGINSNLVARFSPALTDGTPQTGWTNFFSLYIDDQPAAPLAVSFTAGSGDEEHAVTFELPNFYAGDSERLHTLQVRFERDGYPLLQAQRQAFAEANEDSNNDGIPDAWEAGWGLSAGSLSASGDHDGDGVSDYWEYLANTDPTDDTKYFAIHDSWMTVSNRFALTFPAGLNRDFSILATPSLNSTNWHHVPGSPMSGTGQFVEWYVTPTNAQSYFKLRADFPRNP
jgi:glycosidase